jgi:hypothetical protein
MCYQEDFGQCKKCGESDCDNCDDVQMIGTLTKAEHDFMFSDPLEYD